MARSRVGERWIGVGLVFAGYCAVQGIAVLLRCPPINVSPLWLPVGYVTGVFVATEKRHWGWWWVAMFCACVLTLAAFGYPLGGAVWAGAFLPLAAAVVALLVERQPGEGRELNLRRLIVMALGGTVVFWVMCIVPAGTLGWMVGYPQDYVTFFGRQAVNLPLNMVLVAPMVVAVIESVRAGRWPVRWGEAVMVGLALFWSAWLAFWVNDGRLELDCLVYLPLPALLWLAIRFEVGGTAAGMLLVACVAFFTAAHREGPFAYLPAAPRVLAVQLCVLVLGVPVVFLSSVVVEREKMREKSRKSDRLFRAFVENAPVPVILNPSPDDGRLYVNPAFTRVLGYTREEITTAAEYFAKVYPNETYREERRVAWDNIVKRAEESGVFQDLGEAETHAKNGMMLHMQARVALVQGHKLIFFSDLTARRKTEAELRLTQYAVDRNPAMIYRIDTAGRFVYANEAACRGMGYSPAELMTKHLWDVAGTVSREGWELRMASLREQGTISLESVFTRRDGSTFPAEVRSYFIEFNGEGYFFTFAFDITARRQAQEAVQKHLKQIEQLAAELTRSEEQQRRDLAAILHDGVGQNLFAATTQLLAINEGQDGAAASQVAGIEKVVAILDQVAKDTRNLTFELCPPVLYQMGLAKALQKLVDNFAAKYRVACTLEGDAVGPEDLNLRGLAYQGVRELLNNAAKHANAQRVVVTLEQTAEAVELIVADDGVGTDEEEVTRPRDGFGLYRLRERIQLLGGTFAIESGAGKGFVAKFSLPMRVISGS